MSLHTFIVTKNFSSLSSTVFLRNVSTSIVQTSAYECDGKTTVTVLNKEAGFGVMIDSYSKKGFRLNNGMSVIGPMVLFPHTAFCWNVSGDEEINGNSLSIFGLIEPKLDLLIVGYGKRSTASLELNKQILALKANIKLNIELLSVEKAAATFNYLSSERRWVAGAFIPPEVVNVLEHEALNERARKREIYEIDDYI